MSSLVQKETYISHELHRALHQLATKRRVSEATIIREALERYLDAVSPADDPLDRLIGTVEGLPADASEKHDCYLHDADRPQ